MMFSEKLVNEVAERLQDTINEMEEAGLDDDQIEAGIDEWFDELKAEVRQKV